MTHAAEELVASERRRPGIGWGGWMAVAGLVLLGLALLQIAVAFYAEAVDEPGQWIPVYLVLGVIALLAIGLAFRSRLAYVGAMAVGLFGMRSVLPRFTADLSVSSRIIDLITLVAAIMVVAGLLLAWRRYWRAEAEGRPTL